MVRPLASLFALLVSLSLAAQAFRFNPERQVSVARLGIPGYGFGLQSQVASNGQGFLAVWYDNRGILDFYQSDYGWSGQAMRFGTDGAPLDAQSIYLPMQPSAVIWAGSHWVVLGSRGIVRVGVDGVLIDREPLKIPFASSNSIAWTGDGFVIVGASSSGRLHAATFDMQLRLVADRELADFTVNVLGVAGDGQSAVVAYVKVVPGPRVDQPLLGASFGRDGLLRKNEVLYSRAGFHPSIGAIGASDAGTVLVVQNDEAQEALLIGRDLQTKHMGTIGITDDERYTRFAPVLAWDGANFTFVSARSTNMDRDLVATRISGDGRYVDSALLATHWAPVLKPFSVAAVSGRTLLAYEDTVTPNASGPVSSFTKARSFAAPSAFASASDVTLQQGALNQAGPAAASSATQSLVAWRERITPIGSSFGVFATRLDAEGEVLDPQSIPLGINSCPGVDPAVVSDGRDFIVAWAIPGYIVAARVGSDGTVTRKSVSYTTNTGDCAASDLALATNGTNFLVVWESPTTTQSVYDIMVAPISADFGPDGSLPVEAHRIGRGQYSRFLAASDGHDYLVVAGNHAARVTADGLAWTEFTQDVLLGDGSASALWWNGTRYVVWTIGSDSKSRFLRIGTDGSGGVNPFGPQPAGISLPASMGSPFAIACDAGGCWLPMTTLENGNYGVTMARLDDDGTAIQATLHPVTNARTPKNGYDFPPAAGVVSAGNLLVIRNVQLTEKPYSGVHRVIVNTFAPSRSRSVRH
jgi:hypothetical protein